MTRYVHTPYAFDCFAPYEPAHLRSEMSLCLSDSCSSSSSANNSCPPSPRSSDASVWTTPPSSPRSPKTNDTFASVDSTDSRAESVLRVRCGRSLTNPELTEIFSRFGKPVVRMNHDTTDGSFTGMAVVRYREQIDVRSLYDELHGTVQHGHMMYIELPLTQEEGEMLLAKMDQKGGARKANSLCMQSGLLPGAVRADFPTGSRIFVQRRVPQGITDVQMHEVFSKFGEIEFVTVVPDRIGGRPASRGFVKFYTPVDADAVLAHFAEAMEDSPKGWKVRLAEGHQESKIIRHPGHHSEKGFVGQQKWTRDNTAAPRRAKQATGGRNFTQAYETRSH